MREHHRLPNGELTRNAREYSKAWHDLAKPIEQATKSRLHSYDPGLAFIYPDSGYTFQLGTHEAKLLSKALEAK